MTADVAARTYGFYSTAPKLVAPQPGPPAPADQAPAGLGPLAQDDPRHGLNGYTNLGCRCDDCKAANREQQQKWRAARRTQPVPDHVHGTVNGYHNYYCKCLQCRAAGNAEHRRRYKPSPRWALQRAETKEWYADHKAGLTVAQVAAKWGVRAASVYNRFSRAGLPTIRRSDGTSTAMYWDYCTGLSVGEVAEKWGVSPQVVSGRFTRMGFARRRRTGGPVRPSRVPRGMSFDQANDARAAEAGARNAVAAREALARTADGRHRMVLELRATYPTDSLAELGGRCEPPMSKDAFAGVLRRALANAEVAR